MLIFKQALNAFGTTKTPDMPQSQSTSNIGKIQFGMSASSSTSSVAPIVFGAKDTSVASAGGKSGLFDFSSKAPFGGFPKPAGATPDATKPAQVSSVATPVFGQAGMSFSDLASAAKPLGFGGGFKTNQTPNSFMMFGGQQASTSKATGLG